MISLLLIGLVGLAYLGYHRWSENRAMATGDVFPDPTERSAAAAAAPPAQAGAVPASATQVTPTQTTRTQAVPTPSPGSPKPAASTPPAGEPATDTIKANPPNGMVFAGSGRFQVYRQGDLTWRLDTNTGQTCVLFATNAEWRKPQVYRHGCNSRATR
ncbi:MAG TPA: hypothetical protein VH250_02040 [Granulicella sp.]|nr:hypothetical protein [Granulicella sp.]